MDKSGPDTNVPYWHSDRQGYHPRWIIVHDTEGSAEGALAWWKSGDNPARSSAHYIVRSNGEIIPVVPEEYAAHHAGLGSWPGIPSGSVGGTAIINLCSLGVELEYPPAPASPPWPSAQLSAAAELVANLAKKYNIPRDNILQHKDVDPVRRSDPRNFDWDAFIADVAKRMNATSASNEQNIRAAAWGALGIQFDDEDVFVQVARRGGLGCPVTARIQAAGVVLQGYSGGIIYHQDERYRVIKW